VTTPKPCPTPIEEINAAAKLMRERAEAAQQGAWTGRSWSAEKCGDDDAGNCACIVYQGEYQPWDKPQIPPIQYVCDAESPEHAAHIAGMHPLVALSVAAWLGTFEARMPELDFAATDWNAALTIARAYLKREA
jgi:hypothetical protein